METSLRVIFAGTPDFAAEALEALIHSRHRVVSVYTQPDRKAGRGLKIIESPVKKLALLYQLPIYQPGNLKEIALQEFLENCNADVMVVAAYGILLPPPVLAKLRLGCINIHPSLLPRWRGAAPIERAIYAGDTITGVTIMQMDQGLDTGPILLQRQYILDPDETAGSLQTKLAHLGAEALIETLDLLATQQIQPRKQDSHQASYAHKITKEEALLDWNRSAIDLEHEVRAFNPKPVAYTSWQGQPLRIWQAKAIDHTQKLEPRTIVQVSPTGLDIATGVGILRLLTVQLPGGKILSIRDFYNAKHPQLRAGEHFV